MAGRQANGFVLACLLAAAVATVGVVAAAGALGAHDKTPPETTITGGPGSRTTDTTPTFSFTANETSRFVCKRDGKPFKPCASPKTLKPLSRGKHGFYVRAIDPFDNRDPTAAAYVFKIVRP